MKASDITVELKNDIQILRINRPRFLNALRKQTLQEVGSALDAFRLSSKTRALVITGQGGRAFCAGGDIYEMKNMNQSEAKDFAIAAHRLVRKMQKCPKPILAAVNGIALGAGCDLASSCDISIASERAIFGMPSANLGIITPFTGTLRFPSMIGPTRAKYLFMTGETFDAPTALHIGLISKIVSHENLLDETLSLAHRILERPAYTLALAKSLLNSASYGHLNRKEKLEVDYYSRCFRMRETNERLLAFTKRTKSVKD